VESRALWFGNQVVVTVEYIVHMYAQNEPETHRHVTLVATLIQHNLCSVME